MTGEKLAGKPGIEPGRMVLETTALPLSYIPMSLRVQLSRKCWQEVRLRSDNGCAGATDVCACALDRLLEGGGLAIEVEIDEPALKSNDSVIAARFIEAICPVVSIQGEARCNDLELMIVHADLSTNFSGSQSRA